MAMYLVANGAMPTTAMLPAVTSGTAIKTMLQVKPFNQVRIVEWGACHDGHASCTNLKFELIETGTINATVVASVDNDIAKYGGAGDQAAASVAGLTLATSGTGYTASAEGTITTSRLLCPPVFLIPTQADRFAIQYPLGREPMLVIGNITRIRVLAAGNAVNVYCYMIIDI